MEYSIQELSRLSGVTTRTLRWYDQIGLLKPSRVAESGYRYYGGAEVDRLQDILYYRALGVKLAQIKECLDDPSFDRLAALRNHLTALEAERERLEKLIRSVKDTIGAEERNEIMSDEQKFEAFKRRTVAHNEEVYGAEIRAKYGDQEVDEANAAVMGLTQTQYQEWTDLGREIQERLEAAVQVGLSPEDQEGKEITVRDFYQFMVDNPAAYPKTSLASIEDFETAFRAHAAAGRDVLCLVFTGKMSGCVGSARNARELVLEDYPDARIEVIDTCAATVTESTMVENAVAMRDAGCSLEETVTWLEAEKVTNQIFFTVGNLDYLIKGGRIGKVTGRAANMLGIKPMILFKEGEIFSGGVARGRQKSFEKALEQLMNYLAAHGGTPDDYRITVGYGYDADEGKRLWMQTRAALRAKYPGAQCEVGLLQIGCTIAVHTGPYALGMGVMRRWKKQG